MLQRQSDTKYILRKIQYLYLEIYLKMGKLLTENLNVQF